MTLFDELHKNRERILAIAAKHGVENVRVFGSVARGEESKDSDIDLLIAMRYDVDPFGFLRFRREVAELMNRKVDVVFENGVSHLLRDEIFSQAQPI